MHVRARIEVERTEGDGFVHYVEMDVAAEVVSTPDEYLIHFDGGLDLRNQYESDVADVAVIAAYEAACVPYALPALLEAA